MLIKLYETVSFPWNQYKKLFVNYFFQITVNVNIFYINFEVQILLGIKKYQKKIVEHLCTLLIIITSWRHPAQYRYGGVFGNCSGTFCCLSTVSKQAVRVRVATITSNGWEAHNSPCAPNKRDVILQSSHYPANKKKQR